MASSLTYPRYRLRRLVLQQMSRLAFKALCRLEVHGRENIPEKGPFIIVGNHFHFADPAVFVALLPWHTEYIAGTQRPTAPNKLVERIPELWGTINVRRGTGATSAIRQATSVLEQQGILAVFPEAGAWAQVLRPARPGTAMLATISEAPILPIGIDGMPDLFPALRQRQRTTVTIRIGRPFGPFKINSRGREKREALEKIGDEIMTSIGNLIPAHKRGVYADDPALRAAAAQVAQYPWH